MEYFRGLAAALAHSQGSRKNGRGIAFSAALKLVERRISRRGRDNKIILIGNGGSAAIASHIATDFLKNSRIPAVSFNDSSLLTCLGNDLGYEYVFSRPIELLAGEGDILFAISSSGRSKNILNAAAAAAKRGCFLVTLSGFEQDNPLRKAGEVNFYVPSRSYGFVEIAHLAICHLIAERFKK